MDPLSVLSLVCNVLDLATRGYKTGKIIKDIYENANGQQESHVQIEHHVADMEHIRHELSVRSADLARVSLNQRLSEALERSQEATEALRAILEDCRSRKLKSFRQSIRAFVRSISKADSIQVQLEKLKECRGKLQMLLVINTNEQVGNIMQILKKTGADLQSMRINLQEVHQHFKQQNDGMNLVLSFDKLKAATQETVLRFNANRILGGLNVQHTRYDEIVKASPFTYQWIYDEHYEQPEQASDESTMLQVMTQAKSNIQSWLRTGTGILHIAGKPGAGKSTLTKFIVKNEHTTKLLRIWAGTTPLVVVKFFFWKPGDWQQNTLRGLKRSVVAQVLQAAPELAQDLFPRQYQEELSMGLLERPSIYLEDVTRAFDRLLGSQHTGILDHYRVCLFLDGLDEFEEAAEDINHSDFMSLVTGWVEVSGGRVKAFVSSRQLPAFNSIAATHRIKLQDITYRDMMDHINGSLEDDKSFQQLQTEDPDGCKEMIRELAKRADGVFLWVTLVIKSVQRGLSNRDPLTKLRTIIRQTPAGLDRLFSRTLCEIIEGPYRREVYILLAIALKRMPERVMESDVRFSGLPAQCPFISLSAAGSLFTAMDSGLELRQIFQRAIANTLHYEEHCGDALDIDEALDIAATQVSGRCLGLLEVVHDPDFGKAVKFLHRSIPEYLEQRVSTQLEILGINSVDVINVMACMVSTDVYYYRRNSESTALTLSTSFGVWYRQKSEFYWRPDSTFEFDILYPRFIFLTRWAKLETIRRQERLDNTTLQLLDSIDRGIVTSTLFQSYLQLSEAEVGRDPIPTVLINACYAGLSQYIDWVLSGNRAGYATRDYQEMLLQYASFGVVRGEYGCSEVIAMLVERGFVPPCTTMPAGMGALDNLWLSLFGFRLNASASSHFSLYTGTFPSPSVVGSSIATLLGHLGSRPTCCVVSHLNSDEAERDKLRGWLRRDGNDDSPELPWFRFFLMGSVGVLDSRFGWKANLSTEVKSFLADLLEEAERTPGSDQEPKITITFDDVMNRFYRSQEIGRSPSSSQLREDEPATKAPECLSSPTPIRDSGLSAYLVFLSIVVVVGAMGFARLLYSDRNVASRGEV